MSSAADLAMAEAEAEERLVVTGGEGNAVRIRTVAGRTFRLDESGEDGTAVWTEVAEDDDLDVTAVEMYSPAFFDLMAALPELRAVVTELQPVVVKGRDVAIRFGDDGERSLSAGQIRRLVERFRTR